MCENCSQNTVQITIDEYKRLLKAEEEARMLVDVITKDIYYSKTLRYLLGTIGITKDFLSALADVKEEDDE